MTANPTIVRTLDGVLRRWDDVFFTGPRAPMRHVDLVGYVVRRTRFGMDEPHEDVARFDANRYDLALEAVRPLRLQDGGYGVIDFIYNVQGEEVRTNG